MDNIYLTRIPVPDADGAVLLEAKGLNRWYIAPVGIVAVTVCSLRGLPLVPQLYDRTTLEPVYAHWLESAKNVEEARELFLQICNAFK